MASVHKRVSPRTGQVRWRVMFRINGTQKQESFLDAASADEFKRTIDRYDAEYALTLLQRKTAAEESAPTLQEYTARYLDASSGLLTGIEPGTRAGYVRAAERSFLPMLGPLPIDHVTKSDVGRWLAWQEAQPAVRGKGRTVAPKTIKNYHAILSAVLASAVEERIRPDNPAYRTRLPKGVREEPVFLTVEEFSTLLHFIPDRHERFVYFLAGTGCRWGEATALMWSTVDLRSDPATVRIERAWKKGETGAPVLKHPKSPRSRRTISMPPDVASALGSPKRADDFVFPSTTGGHLWYGRFRHSVWNPAVDRAMSATECAREGLTPLRRRPTIHDLRHSHASWLIAAGAPLPYIQARLGHESIQTTVNVYGHLLPDVHRQMADAVGSTLAGVRSLRALT